jgi:uncharacterized protein YifN (PemK superfamily)
MQSQALKKPGEKNQKLERGYQTDLAQNPLKAKGQTDSIRRRPFSSASHRRLSHVHDETSNYIPRHRQDIVALV